MSLAKRAALGRRLARATVRLFQGHRRSASSLGHQIAESDGREGRIHDHSPFGRAKRYRYFEEAKAGSQARDSTRRQPQKGHRSVTESFLGR